MTWQTIRTLTTQAAEGTSAPSAGTFVGFTDPQAASFAFDGGRVPFVEIGVDSLTLAGSPTSVTFGVWRLSEGKADRMGSITVASGDVAIAPPATFDFNGESLWLTVESFAGGSTPTVSGSVRVRPLRAMTQRWSDKNPVQIKASPISGTPPVTPRTSLTTVVTLGALACARGFWLHNHIDSGGAIWYAPAGATAPTAAGANASGFIVPGDRKWFGYANANQLQVVSGLGTSYYSVDGE